MDLMFGTPDFGRSDIWHFAFAVKYHLSEALKNGYLPLWSKDLGTGFPLFAEGQAGLFNLYNLLAFWLLDPITAFNLGYVVIMLTAAGGAYLYGRTIYLSRSSASFLATIFSLSGIFATHAVHFNLVQTASFLPWEFFLAEKFLQTRRKRWGLLFSLVLSQQIYSGFPQHVFISLVGLGLYVLVRSRQEKSLISLLAWTLYLAGGLALASPKLLLLVQLLDQSPGRNPLALSDFPFKIENLLGFLKPEIFGHPKTGFHPMGSNWGLFWETTGYIGVLPLVLAAFARTNKKYRQFSFCHYLLAAVALILLFGKSGPFSSLFFLPPLSLFRVPARFLLLFVWALTVLSAIGLETIRDRLVKTVVIVASVIALARFSLSYNATIDPKQWLEPPETVSFLRSDRSWFRVYSLPVEAEWNEIFTTSGWQDMRRYYPFRNSLSANQNLYWGISSHNYYSGLAPSRLSWWHSLVEAGITEINQEMTISSQSSKLLFLAGVKYILSPHPLRSPTNAVTLVHTTTTTPQFSVYQTKNFAPHAYLTRNYLVRRAGNFSRSRVLLDPNSQMVVLEKEVAVAADEDPTLEAPVLKNSDLEVVIATHPRKDSLLILSDSYYPGWRVYLDGRETEILPANINQRAVVVPAGDHLVRFIYDPFHLTK